VITAADSAYDRPQTDSFIKPVIIEDSQLFREDEIFYVLNQVKHTAPGVYPPSYWLFKYCALKLSPVTCNHYNLVLIISFSLKNYGSMA
jgi:hypothetical protein